MSHSVGGGGRGSHKPAIGGKDIRALRMLGSYWMLEEHKKAEKEAGGVAAKANKAIDQAPDISASSEQTINGVKDWEREKMAEWQAEGRINKYGYLIPLKDKPDKSALMLYHLFKATSGTRRKEGLSRTQARSLREFLYGRTENTTCPTQDIEDLRQHISDQEKSASTAEPAKDDSPPISEDKNSDHGHTNVSGAETSKDISQRRSPELGSEAKAETHSTQTKLDVKVEHSTSDCPFTIGPIPAEETPKKTTPDSEEK